ncbi:hydrogenase 3 maturation endopeptidase HyCI [Candidatus Bathyarchaeota archaeon]|nr:hydrogenase 3 maturation endopeptidase HyCI [Candidatus Bathyarchaeota archaeon]
MTEVEYNLQTDLERWLNKSKKIVIAGIGNPIRNDDFVGVKIVQELKNKVPNEVQLYECETVPESFLEPIIELNPTHILLIDAALLGLKPGAIRLINPEQVINFSPITSHTLPLRIFCEFIKKTTESKIALLLIEPKNTGFGEKITPEVQAAAEEIIKLLPKLLKK